jgi:hypothetical protein
MSSQSPSEANITNLSVSAIVLVTISGSADNTPLVKGGGTGGSYCRGKSGLFKYASPILLLT